MQDYENALQTRESELSANEKTTYVLRLYVAGLGVKSLAAIGAVKAFCQKHLKDRYEITVVDLKQHPNAALEHQINATPTLIKELPLPLKKVIGRLTDENRIFKALDILPPD